MPIAPESLQHRETEYLVFDDVSNPAHKTKSWVVSSKRSGDVLGHIRWHGPWRQYVIVFHDAIFNRGCLADVDKFLADAMQNWRDNKAVTG